MTRLFSDCECIPLDVRYWSSRAKNYSHRMNEPHDVPDISRWGQTVQAVVTAIRKAGCVEHLILVARDGPLTPTSIYRATTNLILLPGNNWTSAATFVSSGSADVLHKVTNPDGSKTNIAFDVHRYSDSDNSGTNTECVTDNIDGTFRPLAEWLRCNGRQALNTEMGGGNTASCAQYICQQVKFMNENSDGTYRSVVLYAARLTRTSQQSTWVTWDGLLVPSPHPTNSV